MRIQKGFKKAITFLFERQKGKLLTGTKNT